MRMRIALFALALPLLAAGCKKEPASSKPTGPAASPPTSPAPTQPTAGGGMAPEGGQLTGKLLERIDAATYSYLRIATATGEVWAAVPQTTLAVGTDVVVTDIMLNQNFESKTLKRTFPEIYFGNLAGAGAGSPGGMGANPHAPGASGAPTAPVDPSAPVAKVARAEGADGHTIAELFAGKAKLADKTVVVRAKVVKFTPGILGKNWLHLRDGSGAEASKDHDLTVTTDASAAIGDVVLIKGTVHLDKDFGAGYVYALIVEDATLTK